MKPHNIASSINRKSNNGEAFVIENGEVYISLFPGSNNTSSFGKT